MHDLKSVDEFLMSWKKTGAVCRTTGCWPGVRLVKREHLVFIPDPTVPLWGRTLSSPRGSEAGVSRSTPALPGGTRGQQHGREGDLPVLQGTALLALLESSREDTTCRKNVLLQEFWGLWLHKQSLSYLARSAPGTLRSHGRCAVERVVIWITQKQMCPLLSPLAPGLMIFLD